MSVYANVAVVLRENEFVILQIGEIKQARSLATEITAQGAYLYDLLAKEPDNKVNLFN